MPELPLASEVDPKLKDFSSKAVVWTALVAPAGLPSEVQSKLETALEKVVNNPEFEQQVQKMGDRVDWQTGIQTQERVKQEADVWQRVAQEGGLSL